MTDRVAAVVVAGGRGVRAGGDIPKQYQSVGGIPVIRASIGTLASHPGIGVVQAVIQDGDSARFSAACAGLTVTRAVPGGATRQQSVMAGLQALISHAPDVVLVHDAARPFATAALVDRAIAAARQHGAAVPAIMLSDTVKQVDAGGCVVATPDRATLRAVQTPQAFSFETLLDAHRRAAQAGRHDFTDDAALCEWAGVQVHIFEGETTNMKLTTPDDFAKAEAAHLMALGDVRTGIGFDVHAFGDGDHVMLGGIAIPHARGLSGHSDADVVLHALVDAILGALSDGDIGHHFPPSDPQWRGATSDRFLAFAVERVKARGGMIAHLDTTVICEAPKIGPHRDAMRDSIARIAGIAVDRVAVKATTSEQLGFTGRREGIAAMASATVRLPWTPAS
jgi:2-C-methyl-D-erythritol 4-phosphate cytidylyltransferase / 2-C-methyl-D-erythritol 2,4-cyclodiphosphate synthase